MESIVKALFDFDKLPSKLVLIICFLSGIILFVPPTFLAKVKLETFSTLHGQWVGTACISSIAFLAVTLVTTIRKKFKHRSYYKGFEKEIRENLSRLDPVEQSIGREFYFVGSTVNLPMDNPSVVGLQDKHIIRLAQSNLGHNYIVSGNFGMPFMLTDYARKVIEANISLIDLPQPKDGAITDEQRDKVAKTRPPWTKSRFEF